MIENDRKPESGVNHGPSGPSFVVPLSRDQSLSLAHRAQCEVPSPLPGPRLNAGLVVFPPCP